MGTIARLLLKAYIFEYALTKVTQFMIVNPTRSYYSSMHSLKPVLGYHISMGPRAGRPESILVHIFNLTTILA